MVVGNTLCKRTFVAYCVFFLTAILIWRHHEKSIRLEEDKDTLKSHFLSSPTSQTYFQSTFIEKKEPEVDRLNYWLTNNSRTVGINLTALIAPKKPRKYLVYVCHENCGGKFPLKIH